MSFIPSLLKPSEQCHLMNIAHGGRLFMSQDLMLYKGLVEDNTLHHHFVMQFTFALTVPVQLHSEGMLHQGKGGIGTDANVPHKLLGHGQRQLLLFINSVSDIGRCLRSSLFGGSKVVVISGERIKQAVESLSHALASDDVEAVYVQELVADLLQHILPSDVSTPLLDDRVSRVLSFIQENRDRKIRLAQLADFAALSESRLMHLFKQEVGVPLRQYLLYLRLMHAVQLLLAKSVNFTEAAHSAGFSDSAHFTRTCRQMIGFAPSAILHKT